MRNVVRCGTVALVLSSVLHAAPATAAGWLERLSGPGPFVGFQYVFPIWCYGVRTPNNGRTTGPDATSGAAEPEMFRSWDCMSADPDQRRATVGIDVAYLWTNENPLTYSGAAALDRPGVNAFLFVPYVATPIGRAFEAGTGVGFLRLTDRDSSVDFATTKLVLQPVRLTFKPISAFRDGRRSEAFQFGLNAMLLLGRLDTRTFGAVGPSESNPTAQPFREATELLWQAQVRVDLVRLIRGQ